MGPWLLFAHLIGAVVWLGGMTFMLAALRPAAIAELEPPARPRLLLVVLARFFPLVWASIALLLGTGLVALAAAAGTAPPGWNAMAGLGVLMGLVFGYIQFVPYAAARRGARAGDWPAVARALQRLHPLVQLNCTLGWLAVALVVLWR